MDLIRTWSPMFQVLMGVTRDQMMQLSVPEMVDLIDYYQEVKGRG